MSNADDVGVAEATDAGVVTLNDLPDEIILMILERVEIATIAGASRPSFLGKLYKCAECHHNEIKCKHLHPDEKERVLELLTVCRMWCSLIISLGFKKWWNSVN